VIEVALTTATPVAATPPNVTAVAPVKFVPVMVTDVPPPVGPTLGVMLVIVGETAVIVTVIATVIAALVLPFVAFTMNVSIPEAPGLGV
jgi:hypothetical protein